MLDVNTILSRSVGKLLETRQDISRLNLSKQMKVADGTLGRIKYGNGNPNVETLAAIAHFFRVQPWQLLVEGFDPKKPPTLLSPDQTPDGLSDDERELVRVVRLLREPERTYLFKQARSYMEAMEDAQGGQDKSLGAKKTGTNDDIPKADSPLWGTW
jgi:transcriptional regulator with XRE-family HTH domain